MNSICLTTYNRLDHLKQTLQGILTYCHMPYELIIVDDNSKPESGVQEFLKQFAEEVKGKIPVRLFFNETNLGHPATQNKSFDFANLESKCLIHMEADIVITYPGWNKVFEEYFEKYPEIGQIGPAMSGRSDHLQRPNYKEFQWILGGVWGLRPEVYRKIGGWDEFLAHQRECDFCLRVRIAGWRVAEVREFSMIHLGEGDFVETPQRQAELHIGVWNFLKKWNRRFFGAFDYNAVHAMSWDDFPINEWFRRTLTACLGLNRSPQQVVLPHDGEGKDKGWGRWDLIYHTRPVNREREEELANQIKQNYIFKDSSTLVERNSDKSFVNLLEGKELEYFWFYLNNIEELKGVISRAIESVGEMENKEKHVESIYEALREHIWKRQ